MLLNLQEYSDTIEEDLGNRITGGHSTDAAYGWTLDPSQCLTPFWDKEDCRLGGEKRQDKQEIMNKHIPSVLYVGLTSR